MFIMVALIGFLISALGVAGTISPQHLLSMVARVQTIRGLYAIALIRIVIGIILLMAAVGSRAPIYLQVLGGVSIAAGVASPMFGVHRFKKLLGWWQGRPDWVVRIWSLLVILFGVSLVWAAMPASGGSA